MQSQVEIAEVIKTILIDNEAESISLLEVVKKAVPQLSEDSIKRFFSFIVNGQRIDDWSYQVSPMDKVEVLPQFAGGN
jgi:molybdopterin converting factor small subunit